VQGPGLPDDEPRERRRPVVVRHPGRDGPGPDPDPEGGQGDDRPEDVSPPGARSARLDPPSARGGTRVVVSARPAHAAPSFRRQSRGVSSLGPSPGKGRPDSGRRPAVAGRAGPRRLLAAAADAHDRFGSASIETTVLSPPLKTAPREDGAESPKDGG